MKNIVKKLLKIMLVLVLSTIIIYLTLTFKDLFAWCEDNQIQLLGDYNDTLLQKVDSQKIKEMGDNIRLYAEAIEASLKEVQEQENPTYHSIGEYYDPVGFSVWTYLQNGIGNIFPRYIPISILSGVAISIAYTVITSKKLHTALKLIFGYFAVMLIVPPIYMYIGTHRFWSISTTYRYMPIYFYIYYTIICICLFLLNYKVGIKMTKELNQTIKK